MHRRFLFWREIRPPTPVLLTIHFSAAMKTLVFGNLFKLLRLASTFAREVYHLGIKMKTIYIWQSSYSSHQYPQQQIARANVMGSLKSVNKLPNNLFSWQLKNGWLEVLELVALFLFKTGTCDAKKSWQFFVKAIFCFVKICFPKERDKYKGSLINRSSLTSLRTQLKIFLLKVQAVLA